MNTGSIGWAIDKLWAGEKVTRHGWNGPGQNLQLQEPNGDFKMTRPYVYITTVQGDRVPWLASQTDLLADDWEVVS